MTEEELLQILLANAPNPMGQGAQLPPWTDQGTWEDPHALRKQPYAQAVTQKVYPRGYWGRKCITARPIPLSQSRAIRWAGSSVARSARVKVVERTAWVRAGIMEKILM